MTAASPPLVANPDTIRGPIEETFNALRQTVEQQYVADKLALEEAYHAALKANAGAKGAALIAAGLNADGSTPSTYPESADPENTIAPTVTGTAQIAEILTAHEGTWTFNPRFAYQWQRANASGRSPVDIPLANESTYTLTEADVGKKIRCRITGSNTVGHHIAASAYTAVVLQAAPWNTVLPTVTGTPRVDEVLTGTDGTWNGEPTFVRQWERANMDGSGAEDIAGEQDPTYTVAVADVGKKIRLIVTATNDGGQTTVQSAWTTIVLPLPPECTVVPAITGTEQVDEELTASDGTWTGSPTFTRQWQREDADGQNVADIPGATVATYTLVGADEGKKVRCVITGTNDGGQDVGQSTWTGVIAPT